MPRFLFGSAPFAGGSTAHDHIRDNGTVELKHPGHTGQVIWLLFLENCLNVCSGMKKIEAIIKPFRMDGVREALIEIGVEGVTVSEVKMLGRREAHTSIARGGEYFSDFLPKLKFEIVVADSRVRRTVQAIVGKARTGRINGGRVFIVPIQEAIRIRTGERGEAAV
jgi:nitrogen regulatory protein P-II 1